MPTRIPYRRESKPGTRSTAAAYERTADRKDAKRFYSSPRWRKVRASILAARPLCADCQREGITREAVDVHHVRERRDDPAGALDPSNLEGLCKPCHNRRRRETLEREGGSAHASPPR